MRVCVFGAGAIGGQLAMWLARGGAEVSLVMRDAHLEATRRNGLRVIAADVDWCQSLPASDTAADLGTQDVVVVAVKQPSLASFARDVMPLLATDTAVAFVMNGLPWWYFVRNGGPRDGMRLEKLDPGNLLSDAVAPERVIGGVIYSAADVTAPGVVRVANPSGRLILGEPDGSVSDRVQALAETIRAGGLEVSISAAIRDDVWTKIISNMISAPLAIAAQTPLSDLYAEPACARAAFSVVAEMTAVARAFGANPSADADKEIARGQVLKRKPSVLQELERGRPNEVESLFEAPLALARMAGVDTPTTDLLVTLARLRARAAGSC